MTESHTLTTRCTRNGSQRYGCSVGWRGSTPADHSKDRQTMGPYCNFCDLRCFVPDPWRKAKVHGSPVILATCTKGMAHDREKLGYDYAIARVQVNYATAMKLLRQLVDDGDCRLDHHGGCQNHVCDEPDPGEVCPHAAAKQFLASPQVQQVQS